MRQAKKIEIVANSLEIRSIIEALEEIEVHHYSIIKDVQGKGSSGIMNGDEMTDIFKNGYIMIACEDEVSERIIAQVKPIIEEYGGLFLVSDVYRVI